MAIVVFVGDTVTSVGVLFNAVMGFDGDNIDDNGDLMGDIATGVTVATLVMESEANTDNGVLISSGLCGLEIEADTGLSA